MLSPSLIRKLETLNDDALRHIESQVDLLLHMPEHRRAPQLTVVRPGREAGRRWTARTRGERVKTR